VVVVAVELDEFEAITSSVCTHSDLSQSGSAIPDLRIVDLRSDEDSHE
jgi:hypothetical protein